MISADNVRESDISDNPIVDFVRASTSLEESLCSYVDFEASDGGGEKKYERGLPLLWFYRGVPVCWFQIQLLLQTCSGLLLYLMLVSLSEALKENYYNFIKSSVCGKTIVSERRRFQL